jgi:sortase B
MWQKDNSSNSNLQNDLSSLISIKEIDTTKTSEEGDTIIVELNGTSENAENTYLDEIANSTGINDFSVDFESLKAKNPNTVAWIKINNTNINYPIVQGTDNNYYLKRNFSNEKNSAGWIYADYRNNFETLDKNTIIYGHNRRNGTMFSNLNYYLTSKWYTDENNKYFNFITENQNYIAEIFSVYKVSSNAVSLTNTFTSTEEVQANIDAWKNASIYDFNTDVTVDDNLLTLYTCDNNTYYRIIIVSKLIPIN